MLIKSDILGPEQSLDCEVCIIGAGPAGITLALDLARAGRDVILVESGEFARNDSIQSCADADWFDDSRHAAMNMATQRLWGGTSSIWGGRCVPLDTVDFEPRTSRGNASWPIDFTEIARYYPKACEYAHCGAASFTVADVFGNSVPPIVRGFKDGEVTASSLERWSLPTHFGTTYRDEAHASPKLRAFLGLTCIDLQFDDQNRIRIARSRSLSGVQLDVQAQYFVIAAGGLESTRLLMNIDALHPGGLGNHSDFLGRFYMGHISGKIAELQFDTPPRQTIYGFDRDADGVYCRRRFVVSAARQRKDDLLNCALWLDNPPLPNADHRNGILSMAYLALSMPGLSRHLAPEAIRRAAVENPSRSASWQHLLNILLDLPATAAFVPAFVWKRYFARRKIPGFFLFSRSNRYALHYHGEQAPRENSRVRLSESRDELGLRKLHIDLRYSATDAESVVRTHRILDSELQRMAIGHLIYAPGDPISLIDRQAKDGFHQIGTTRMSRRPEEGIVNENCRVHAVDNLYVVSSSVFPTSGQANPTLTVIALAVRLADHLRARLGAELP